MDKKQLIEKMKKHADDFYIKLNPDKNRVDWVFDGLLKNKEKYNELYCPCRVITNEKKRDKLIICPCAYSLGEIELKRECLCRLFVRK